MPECSIPGTEYPVSVVLVTEVKQIPSNNRYLEAEELQFVKRPP